MKSLGIIAAVLGAIVIGFASPQLSTWQHIAMTWGGLLVFGGGAIAGIALASDEGMSK